MIKIELVTHWKHLWKLTSVWVFIVIGVFPDIYDAVIAAGLHDGLPESAKNCLRVLATIGVISRVIKQKVESIPHE